MRRCNSRARPRRRAIREWKDKEGSVFNEKEVQNAARLYFQWLGISLQRRWERNQRPALATSSNTPGGDADQAAIEALEDKIKGREKEPASGANGAGNDKTTDELVKRVHDHICARRFPRALCQALGLTEAVNTNNGSSHPDRRWDLPEDYPPELSARKTLGSSNIEDMKIKRDGEAAARSHLAFRCGKKFAQVRRPELLWKKAEEYVALGQRNKAIGEMFAVVKAHPAHRSRAREHQARNTHRTPAALGRNRPRWDSTLVAPGAPIPPGNCLRCRHDRRGGKECRRSVELPWERHRA